MREDILSLWVRYFFVINIMAAAASGGGSAAPPSESATCPTNFSRFEMFNPRAPLGFLAKCARGMGLVSSNLLTNYDVLDRLGYDKVFGRYYHLYDMYMNRPDKHKTTAQMRRAFNAIETARKLAIENFKIKRNTPTEKSGDISRYLREARDQASAIEKENALLSQELVFFTTFLGRMYNSEIRALEREKRRIISDLGLPEVPTVDPRLMMRFNALSKTRRHRKCRRTTRKKRSN